jgi:hypothetical protein
MPTVAIATTTISLFVRHRLKCPNRDESSLEAVQVPEVAVCLIEREGDLPLRKDRFVGAGREGRAGLGRVLRPTHLECPREAGPLHRGDCPAGRHDGFRVGTWKKPARQAPQTNGRISLIRPFQNLYLRKHIKWTQASVRGSLHQHLNARSLSLILSMP